jgi:ATP-binding cassette, subfamily F, member 3
MIIIKNLYKKYGDNVIFENAGLKIDSSDKIALLSQNGKGKTTLVRCISGLEDFEGTIDSNSTVSLMEQEKNFSKIAETFAKYIDMKTQKIQKTIADLEEKFADPAIYENIEIYNKLIQDHELLCKRKVEAIEEVKLKEILQNIGFSLDLLNREINKLSGGEQTAIRLAECLARDADLYILDEPTNHLDYRAIKWLEDKIRQSNKTFIVISHDRYFIDRFASKVVEIENNQLVTYKTNYSGYVAERAHHREVVHKNFDSSSKKHKRLMESAAIKRVWAHKNGNKAFKIKAENLERQASKLDLTTIVDDKYDFTVNTGVRTSNRVFELTNIKKSFVNETLFENVNVEITRKDRVVILGHNGVGKSTILKLLMGTIKPDDGTIVLGTNMKIGFFEQKSENLPLKKSVMEYFLNHHHVHENKIVSLARKFGFEHDIQKKKIKSLSGGQKAKLQLMHILLGGFNVLLLDEPTNHLDLELRESLEKALLGFDGAIVFVSHDRYFVEKMANRMLRVEDKTLKPVN